MAKKFEYWSVCEKDLGYKCEKLKQCGQEGWELVGISPKENPPNNLYIFKREIESPLTHKQEQNGYDMGR